MKLQPYWRMILPPMLAICLAGCAVLTVDVDVYKGPLANKADVQTDQTVMTAIAAKPLLGKLRFELEKFSRHSDLIWIRPSSTLINPDIRVYEPRRGAEGALNDVLRLEYWHDFYRTDVSLLDRKYEFDEFLGHHRIGVPFDSREAAYPFQFQSLRAEFVNRVLAEYNDDEENEHLMELQKTPGTKRSGVPHTMLTTGITFDAQYDANEPGDYDAYIALKKARGNENSPSKPKTQSVVLGDRYGSAERYAQYKLQLRKSRARSGPGIETLIFLYLREKDRRNSVQSSRDSEILTISEITAREKLYAALIHFSQKILFVANNEALFAERDGIPHVLAAGIRSLISGGPDGDANANSYVSVLQAVGNSLLVSINELKEFQDFNDKLSEHKARDLTALQTALKTDPSVILSALLKEIRAEIDELERKTPLPKGTTVQALTDAKKAVDDATAKLEATKVPLAALTEALDGRNGAKAVESAATDTSEVVETQAITVGKAKEKLTALDKVFDPPSMPNPVAAKNFSGLAPITMTSR